MKNKQKKLQNDNISTIVEMLNQPIEVVIYETLTGKQLLMNGWIRSIGRSEGGLTPG